MTRDRIGVASLAVAVLAAATLAPAIYRYYNPYEYTSFGALYQFVRIAVTVSAAYIAYQLYEEGGIALAMVATATAILFNPFRELHLGRDDWQIADVAVAVLYAGFGTWRLFRATPPGGHLR